MTKKPEYKSEVLSAVRQYIQSLDTGRKAVADFSMVVEATSQLTFANLDAWEQLLRWELLGITKDNRPLIWKWIPRPERPVTWLDLCSDSGFNRETALRSLSGGAPNGFFFALAVRRLNDWVPQVRAAAREKLLKIAKNTDPEHVVDALCAILPLWNSWGRITNVEREAFLALASIEEVTLSLQSRIISATTGPMTSILAQVGRTPALDPYLDEIAKNAIQPAVRAKAYRCLLEGKMVWVASRKWKLIDKRWSKFRFVTVLGERPVVVALPFLETLKLAIMDRSPMVRRVAGAALIREMDTVGAEALHLATLLASDPSPSVAERGRFVLSQLGNDDK